MRGRHIPHVMEFEGHRFDESVLTCLSSGSTEYWSIDVPAVLWMLDRIAAGDVDATTARDRLRVATLWDSDCCGDCDRAMAHYDKARARHEAAVQRWEQQQEQLDVTEYPYILNKGKIHTLSCQRVPQPASPWFPETLHGFAIFFEACGENLDAVFQELERRASRDARRMSVGEVLTRITRYGHVAVKAKLCRACRPPLPDLDLSATTLRPACWEWPTDPNALEELSADASLSTVSDANILPEQGVAFAMLERWHDGRCAICGEVPIQGGLVRDHDHASGMIRGLLCYACNTIEGRSTSLLFANYRQRPPAAILAIEVLYLPVGFRLGAGHLLAAGRGATP